MNQKLSNGAILTPLRVEDCYVCSRKGQEIDAATHTLEFEGRTIPLCRAHTQQVQEMDQDKEERDTFKEFMFGQYR